MVAQTNQEIERELQEKIEDEFIEEVNALVEKYGMCIDSQSGELYINIFGKSYGSDVVFSMFRNRYELVREDK
jgi:hypothetical protein